MLKIRQRKECFSFENFLQIQQPLLEKVIASQLEIRSKQTVKRTFPKTIFIVDIFPNLRFLRKFAGRA